MEDNIARFRNAVSMTIEREGIADLMDWVENETDFYTSPASTRFHGSYEGGLVEHSLNVFNQMLTEMETMVGPSWDTIYPMESIAVIALFHDLCKVNRYQRGFRNVKDENGEWYQKEVYEYNPDAFEMGHGSLSITYLNRFIRLTKEESQAIFWHMGAFDISPYAHLNGLSSANTNNPLAFLIQRADMAATYVIENEKFITAFEEVVEDEQHLVDRSNEVSDEQLGNDIRRREPSNVEPSGSVQPSEDRVGEDLGGATIVEGDKAIQPRRTSTKISIPNKVEAQPEVEPEPVQDPEPEYTEEVEESEFTEEIPLLTEDFFYLNTVTGKYGKMAEGTPLDEEYDPDTWEPVTEEDYLKYTKPVVTQSARTSRKTPTPQNRPR